VREKLTGSPAVFKGEKAQSCGSGIELHMAGSRLCDQSCQSKSLVEIPWLPRVLPDTLGP